MWLVQTCQRSRFSRESPSLIKSPSLPVRASNLRPLWNTYRGLFQNSFINFVILKMSKTNIKQELDLVRLFELISMESVKQSNQIDIYLTSIVIGQKSTNQIVQCMVESWRGFRTLLSTSGTFGRPSGDFRRVFRHCPNWNSYNTKISRHLQIFVLRKLAGRLVEKYNRRKLVWRGCYENICQ